MKKYKVAIPEGMKVKRELWPTRDSKQVVIEFEPIEKELPKTWEEYSVFNKLEWDTAIFLPDKYLEAFRSLAKLIELRDHYNDGWMPDWTDIKKDKWIIRSVRNEIKIIDFAQSARVLSFENKEIANEFLSNFAQLIETAKPLL